MKFSNLCVLLAVLLIGCTASREVSHKSDYNYFKSVPITYEVELAAQAAVQRIPKNNYRLSEIIGAESQIVTGTNYNLVFILEDQTVWEALVFQDLKGNNFVEYVIPFETE